MFPFTVPDMLMKIAFTTVQEPNASQNLPNLRKAWLNFYQANGSLKTVAESRELCVGPQARLGIFCIQFTSVS